MARPSPSRLNHPSGDWHYERRAQTQLPLLLFEGRWLFPFYLRNGQGKPWDERFLDSG